MSASVIETSTLTRSRQFIRVAWLPVVLSVIMVIGFGLRLHGIDAKSLWYDEGTSLYFAGYFANQSLAEMIRVTVERDTHSPFYYLLLHGWMQALGDDVATLRALSAVASILCLPLVYILARAITDRATALVAMALVAISPFQIWYAQEVRMYALLTLAGLASTLALVRLIQCPGWSRWLIYVVLTGAMLWVQYVAMLTLMAQMVVVLALTWRGSTSSSVRRWLWSAPLAAGLLFLPWVPAFLAQNQLYSRFWIPVSDLERLERVLLDMNSMNAPYWRLPGDRPILVFIAFALLAITGAVALRRQGQLAWLLPVTLILLPLTTSFVIGLFRPLFLARTLIIMSPFWSLLVAAGLVALIRLGWSRLTNDTGTIRDVRLTGATLAHAWPLGAACLGLFWVVSWNTLSLQNIYRNVPKEPWNEAARIVAQEAGPGDIVVFHSAPSQWPFDYYFQRQGRSLVTQGVPRDANQPQGALEELVTPANLATLTPLLARGESIWLILSHDEFNDPDHLVENLFNSDCHVRFVEERELYNIRLRHYAPRPDCRP